LRLKVWSFGRELVISAEVLPEMRALLGLPALGLKVENNPKVGHCIVFGKKPYKKFKGFASGASLGFRPKVENEALSI
jgi:hypothetical protein